MTDDETPWPRVYGPKFVEWWDNADHKDRIQYLRKGAPIAYDWMGGDYCFKMAASLIARTANKPIRPRPSLAELLVDIYRRDVIGQEQTP